MAGFLVVPRRTDHRELVAVNAELRGEVRRLRREVERLRVENEILREAAAPLIHQAPACERFAFIHRLRDRFAVKRLCRILVRAGAITTCGPVPKLAAGRRSGTSVSFSS
jgi:hypothetical protein